MRHTDFVESENLEENLLICEVWPQWSSLQNQESEHLQMFLSSPTRRKETHQPRARDTVSVDQMRHLSRVTHQEGFQENHAERPHVGFGA